MTTSKIDPKSKKEIKQIDFKKIDSLFQKIAEMDCNAIDLETIIRLKGIKLDADPKTPSEERSKFEKLKKENPNAIEEIFEYKIINETLLIDNFEKKLIFLAHKIEIPLEIKVCLMQLKLIFNN